LRNPRHAGYQVPTKYAGYRRDLAPSQWRRPRTRDTELVPCLLPALWDLGTYYALLDTAAKRWRSPKRRGRYRAYLLSGIAYDPECGHRMQVSGGGNSGDGRFWMVCKELTAEGRHGSRKRGDIAEKELDALLANLSFDDPGLERQIENELRRLDQAEQRERVRFKPNPKISAVKQALATLSAAGIDSGRVELEHQLAELLATDEQRREALHEPLVQFRRALAWLKKWPEVWAAADMHVKNKLLRDAGVRVEIGRLPTERVKHPPMRVLSVSAENPAFSMALAIALARTKDKFGNRPVAELIPAISLPMAEEPWASAARRHLRWIDGSLALERPPVPIPAYGQRIPPQVPGGPWLTVRQVAERTGVTKATVRRWIMTGKISAIFIPGPPRGGWRLISVSELVRLGCAEEDLAQAA
jgi:excisionase family DNA binding protein